MEDCVEAGVTRCTLVFHKKTISKFTNDVHLRGVVSGGNYPNNNYSLNTDGLVVKLVRFTLAKLAVEVIVPPIDFPCKVCFHLKRRARVLEVCV